MFLLVKYAREGITLGSMFGAFVGLSQAQKDYYAFVEHGFRHPVGGGCDCAYDPQSGADSKYDTIGHTTRICLYTACGAVCGLAWPVTAPITALYLFLDQANKQTP